MNKEKIKIETKSINNQAPTFSNGIYKKEFPFSFSKSPGFIFN
jgi:hypothetical protein